MSSDAERLVRSYLASFEARDPEVIASHVSEDFFNEHTAALGSSCRGRDEYLRRLPGFLESMPGMRYEVEDVIAADDRVVATYTLHATIDNRSIEVRGAMVFRVADGEIDHRTDYWDSKVFLDQLGD